MKSFNTCHNGNPMLGTILLKYACIRLSFTPKNIDELSAGMVAIFTVYLSTIPSLKTVTGNGAWALPILHMLNDYMKFCHVTGISFHPEEETDVEKGIPQRDSHNELVIIQGAHCLVEKCKSVCKELQNFATKFTEANLSTPPEPDPEKEDGTPEEEKPPKKRPRCILDLGDSPA